MQHICVPSLETPLSMTLNSCTSCKAPCQVEVTIKSLRREFSGSGQVRQSSPSHSPHRSASSKFLSRHQASLSALHQPSSSTLPSKQNFFQSGTDSKGPPVCAMCLGQNVCKVSKCCAENLWDGSKVRCQNNTQEWLVIPTGTILCHDWNTQQGCLSAIHGQQHECSWCKKKDHGAQKDNPMYLLQG